MNKSIHMPWLSAILALTTAASHPSAQAAAMLPDCHLDDKEHSECFQPFSEGLAAVLQPITGLRDGRWGFIDAHGTMVIRPGYDQVRPFTKGLAAALRNGKWGYIDTKGHWVIEPLYDQASNFGTNDQALVTLRGELLRINRAGEAQSIVPASQRAVLHDPVDTAAQRWSISLEPYAQLWNLQQGRILPLPDGLSTITLPQDGLIPAEKRLPSGAEYWGLLNLQGNWAMSPRLLQSKEQPLHDQGLVARRTEKGWQFVNLQGEVQHTGTLHEVHLIRPGSWVVAPEEGQLELWDAKARHVMKLPSGLGLYKPAKIGDSVVLEAQDHVALVAPQGRAWHWATMGRQISTAQSLLWLLRDSETHSRSSAVRNEVIRPNGQPFLDAATQALLSDYQVTPMNPQDARFSEAGVTPIALAVLEPLDSDRPPAILTRDGHIVSRADWLQIRPRHDSTEPWVVQNREGLFGAIDGDGVWRVPPTWQALDDFNHGVAMGRRADVADGRRRVLLDSQGQLLNSPPEVTQDCTRWIGVVLACVNDQGAALQQYLWHPLRQVRTDIEQIRQIIRLTHGLYNIQQGQQWGVLDSEGAWRIPPRLASEEDLRPLDQEVGLETVHDSKDPLSKRYRLISLKDGHPLTALHLKEPERMGEDRYLVHTEHEGSRLINARGETLLRQTWPSANTRTDGPWATVQIDDVWGVMDLQGQWHVAPRYRHLTGPFGPDQWLSVQTQAGIDLLVNAEGQPMDGAPVELASQPTPTPPPALRLTQRGRKQVFVDARGQVAITAEVQCMQMVLRNAQGQQTWPLPPTPCNGIQQQGARP